MWVLKFNCSSMVTPSKLRHSEDSMVFRRKCNGMLLSVQLCFKVIVWYLLRFPFSRLLAYYSEALLAFLIRLVLAIFGPPLFHTFDGRFHLQVQVYRLSASKCKVRFNPLSQSPELGSWSSQGCTWRASSRLVVDFLAVKDFFAVWDGLDEFFHRVRRLRMV